jgi:hypothetical protein
MPSTPGIREVHRQNASLTVATTQRGGSRAACDTGRGRSVAGCEGPDLHLLHSTMSRSSMNRLGFDAGFMVEASPGGTSKGERSRRPRILRAERSQADCAGAGCCTSRPWACAPETSAGANSVPRRVAILALMRHESCCSAWRYASLGVPPAVRCVSRS